MSFEGGCGRPALYSCLRSLSLSPLACRAASLSPILQAQQRAVRAYFSKLLSPINKVHHSAAPCRRTCVLLPVRARPPPGAHAPLLPARLTRQGRAAAAGLEVSHRGSRWRCTVAQRQWRRGGAVWRSVAGSERRRQRLLGQRGAGGSSRAGGGHRRWRGWCPTAFSRQL